MFTWLSAYASVRFPAKRNLALYSGVILMSLHLFFWKYFSWLSHEIQLLFPQFLGGRAIHLPLPVGISFFTLQGIAYLIDLKRAQFSPLTFPQFILFKSFFAQLVAGPIVRLSQIRTSIEQLNTPTFEQVRSGLFLMLLGLFKKVVIADRVGYQVQLFFNFPPQYTSVSAVMALLGFYVQIWADFSGYSDMGIGAAKLLGIQLPDNFRSPYLSTSMTEFWKRWHITLSNWIRDYIYNPMGGGSGSLFKKTGVLFFTMALSGLWHGAGWGFLFWGLFHGVLISIEAMLNRLMFVQKALTTFPRLVLNSFGVLYTFFAFNFGIIFFRSDSFEKIKNIFQMLFHESSGGDQINFNVVLMGLGVTFLIQIAEYRSYKDSVHVPLILKLMKRQLDTKEWTFSPLIWGLNFAILLFIILVFRFNISNPFIYFQF